MSIYIIGSLEISFSLHLAPHSTLRLNWTNKQITNKFDFVTRARNSWSIFSYGNWIFFLFSSRSLVLNPKSLITQASKTKVQWGEIMYNLSKKSPSKKDLLSAGKRRCYDEGGRKGGKGSLDGCEEYWIILHLKVMLEVMWIIFDSATQ